jgi:tetratricopeptide (TPR) repeat protein
VGISYLMKGELDQALESCEKARCLALDLDSQWFLAESLFGIGAAKEAKGDKRGALGYYQQALAAGEAAGFELVVGLASSKLESLTNSQG